MGARAGTILDTGFPLTLTPPRAREPRRSRIYDAAAPPALRASRPEGHVCLRQNFRNCAVSASSAVPATI